MYSGITKKLFTNQDFIKMKIKIREIAKKNKGYSLYKLAKELHLPQQTVYSWANGRTQPSYENMDRLCDALECTIGDYLNLNLYSTIKFKKYCLILPD